MEQELRGPARLVLVLTGLALPALVPMHLALTDIHYGEPDLSAEWWAVRWGSILTVLALLAGLRLARRVLRTAPQ